MESSDARVTDFLEQLEKFIDNLGSARDNMQGHITLADTEYGYLLDDMSTPTDYQSAGKWAL